MEEPVGLSTEEALKCCFPADPSTKDYIFQQTMYRIKDPKKSLEFYTRALGMKLLQKCDFPDMKFSLYFLGYEDINSAPSNPKERCQWAFSKKATLELTHNWGSDIKDDFSYHNGNSEPRGYGHIGIMVPDLNAACKRMEDLNVPFVKKPSDGKMRAVAFIKDPDGYWIELFNANDVANMLYEKI